MQLDWFWNEWLSRGGEPAYEVSFSQRGNGGELVVKQTQNPTEVTGYKTAYIKCQYG